MGRPQSFRRKSATVGREYELLISWRVPAGIVHSGARVLVLDSNKPLRRVQVRVLSPSEPLAGFEGWIDVDLLA